MKKTIKIGYIVNGPEVLLSGAITATELVVRRTYLETSLTWISDLVNRSVLGDVIRANYSDLVA